MVTFQRIKQFLSAILLVPLVSSIILPPVYAQSLLPLNPGLVTLSQPFCPLILQGIRIDPANPLKFDFLVLKGDAALDQAAIRQETARLIRYFLATLTIPDSDLWVNLSPEEKDRIIPDEFGKTEMGQELLAQDYLLKKLTASLMYPEQDLGREFWQRIRQEIKKRYGDLEIPTDSFHKVWIMPEKAVVFEGNEAGMITESRLKVLLEEDYLGAPEPQVPSAPETSGEQGNWGTGELIKQVLKEIILPEIEKEVNEGEHFAPLRQIYHSIILATWYKRNLKKAILSKIYIGRNKLAGIDLADRQAKEKIYQQYLETFRQGIYDYIKEDYDPKNGDVIPRRYFSGGMEFAGQVDKIYRRAARPTSHIDSAMLVRADLVPESAQAVMEIAPQFAVLVKYLQEQNNDPTDIRKVVQIMTGPGPKLLELAGGDTSIATAIASKTEISVITTDLFHLPNLINEIYRGFALNFQKRALPAQRMNPEQGNIVAVRSDATNIFDTIPDESFDYILLTNPDSLILYNIILHLPQIAKKLVANGKILIRPYVNENGIPLFEYLNTLGPFEFTPIDSNDLFGDTLESPIFPNSAPLMAWTKPAADSAMLVHTSLIPESSLNEHMNLSETETTGMVRFDNIFNDAQKKEIRATILKNLELPEDSMIDQFEQIDKISVDFLRRIGLGQIYARYRNEQRRRSLPLKPMTVRLWMLLDLELIAPEFLAEYATTPRPLRSLATDKVQFEKRVRTAIQLPEGTRIDSLAAFKQNIKTAYKHPSLQFIADRYARLKRMGLILFDNEVSARAYAFMDLGLVTPDVWLEYVRDARGLIFSKNNPGEITHYAERDPIARPLSDRELCDLVTIMIRGNRAAYDELMRHALVRATEGPMRQFLAKASRAQTLNENRLWATVERELDLFFRKSLPRKTTQERAAVRWKMVMFRINFAIIDGARLKNVTEITAIHPATDTFKNELFPSDPFQMIHWEDNKSMNPEEGLIHLQEPMADLLFRIDRFVVQAFKTKFRQRNTLIIRRFYGISAEGEVENRSEELDLAQEFGVTEGRISQMISQFEEWMKTDAPKQYRLLKELRKAKPDSAWKNETVIEIPESVTADSAMLTEVKHRLASLRDVLQQYDNNDDTIETVLRFLSDKRKKCLELASGNTKQLTQMADRHPEIAFIGSDKYDLNGEYMPIAEDFYTKALPAQLSMLENLETIQAGAKELLDAIPDNTLDYLIVIHPEAALVDYIFYHLSAIAQKLAPDGQIIIKPFWDPALDVHKTDPFISQYPFDIVDGSSPILDVPVSEDLSVYTKKSWGKIIQWRKPPELSLPTVSHSDVAMLSTQNSLPQAFTIEEYNRLTARERNRLRQQFEFHLSRRHADQTIFTSQYPLKKATYLSEMRTVADSINDQYPTERIVALGRSPVWFVETARLLTELDGDTNATDRYGYIAFSGRDNRMLNPQNSNVSAFRDYLSSIGMDPHSIVSAPERTVIVEFVREGLSLKHFIAVLMKWASEQGLQDQVKAKLHVHALKVKGIEKMPRLADITHTIQYVSYPLLQGLGTSDPFEDSLGVEFGYKSWGSINPVETPPAKNARLVEFRIIDFLMTLPDFQERSQSSAAAVSDSAMITQKQAPGGIDLTAASLALETTGEGVAFDLPSVEELESMTITGFTPVIVDILPMPSIPIFLGLNELDPAIKEEEQLVSKT